MDGLRAIAAFAVVASHCHIPHTGGGTRGVDVFFVLSGFLITGLLRDEMVATGGLAFRRFWWRRILRLLPAYYLMLAVYGVLATVAFPGGGAWLDAILSGVYLSPLLRQRGAITPLVHTWSLAVEMIFYLVWPAVFVLLYKFPRRVAVIALLGAWAALTLHRTMYAMAGGELFPEYFSPLGHSSGLLLGAALALSDLRAPGWLSLAGVAGLVALVIAPDTHQLLWAIAAAEIATAAVLAGLASASALKTVLSTAPAVALGQLSYGVYLWHLPLKSAIEQWPWWLQAPAVAAGATALAAISFFTVERWAKRLRPRPGPGAVVTSPALRSAR